MAMASRDFLKLQLEQTEPPLHTWYTTGLCIVFQLGNPATCQRYHELVEQLSVELVSTLEFLSCHSPISISLYHFCGS